MNSKSHIPDELIMFNRQFSLRVAWSVCRWWFLAFLISTLFDVVFWQEVKQWTLGWQVMIIFGEFFAILLFIFDVVKWVRGMDELQRRITLAAFLFSVSASFIFFLLWLRLERAGFFNAIFGPPVINGTWGISSLAHACTLLGGFYGVGFLIFKRRYK
jgi:hypothetical protein